MTSKQEPLFQERKDGLLEYCGPVERAAEVWSTLDDQKEGDIWTQASIAAKIVPTYGKEDMKKFAEQVELSPAYVRRMAKTYRFFTEKETRVSNLRFNLHALSLRHPDPKEALLIAGENGWGRVRLLEWIINTAVERGTGKDKKPTPFSELDKTERAEWLKALRDRMSAELKQCSYKEYRNIFSDAIETIDWEIHQLDFQEAERRVEEAIKLGHRTQKQIEKHTHLSPLETGRVIGKMVSDDGAYEWREQRGETDGSRGGHTMMLFRRDEPFGNTAMSSRSQRNEYVH